MAETPGKMYALATVLTLLAVTAVGLRFKARYLRKADLAWDDYTIALALVNETHYRYIEGSSRWLTRSSAIYHWYGDMHVCR